MLRAEGADYWIRIGSGKDRRQWVGRSPGSVPRCKVATFSKGVLFSGESVIIGAFGFILHRPIHEDQNQGMKDMHPWNVDLHEMGVID